MPCIERPLVTVCSLGSIQLSAVFIRAQWTWLDKQTRATKRCIYTYWAARRPHRICTAAYDAAHLYAFCIASTCLPVCLHVGYDHEPYKNGWNDRDDVRECVLVGPKEPHVLDGGPDSSPRGRDIFRETYLSMVGHVRGLHIHSTRRCGLSLSEL